MRLSIIIVSWNTKNLLDGSLSSIYKETQDIDFEIFVVDNASSDGSAEMVKEKYPQVKLIENKKNRGFATAVNLALREERGEYILILNPDTVIKNGALDKALDILSERPEVGILGPKTYNKDGTTQKTVRHDLTLTAALLIAAKLPHIFPSARALKNYYYPDFDYSREAYVEQIQGSFMLVRRELFEKLGDLDEKFFLWFEEVDFCLRARKAGWKILYSPAVEIIHHGGESFAQVGTAKKQTMFFCSMFRLFKKHKFFRN